MTFKNRAAQIIKLLPTTLTFIPLPLGLICMITTFVDRIRRTLRTVHSVWPAQFPYDRKTFRIIYQFLDVHHAPILSESFHLLEIS